MKILVHQTAVRSVLVDRTIVLDIPDEIAGDQIRIEEILAKGEEDFGPFCWDPTHGTESIEVLDTSICGPTSRDPDLIAGDIGNTDELGLLDIE